MGPKRENRLETQTWSAPTGKPPLLPTVPGLTILGHPQIQRVGERAALLDLSSGREMLLSRTEPEFSPPGESAPPASCRALPQPPSLAPPAGAGRRSHVAPGGLAHGSRRQYRRQ